MTIIGFMMFAEWLLSRDNPLNRFYHEEPTYLRVRLQVWRKGTATVLSRILQSSPPL